MFLSHPPDHSLLEHSIAVGNKTKEILDDTKLNISKEGFYAGLLHDIGKLNPYYQELFSSEINDDRKKQLMEKYPREHAKFSSWAANYLLEPILGYDKTDIVSCVISAHHTRLAKSISNPESSKTSIAQYIITQNLAEFRKESSDIDNFESLDWDRCIKKYENPIYFTANLAKATGCTISDFVSIGVLFSALLQADRGSFAKWNTPHFDIPIDTVNLIKHDSKLGALRTEFGRQAMENFGHGDSIIILNAPTGIGKTKVFLELIKKFQEESSFERVYYFSPLLALTDDFENKIKTVVPKESQDDILAYNHLFSGSLEEKTKYEENGAEQYKWIFEYESFNEKFIITTMQRLLMILYSNSHSDKLKLVSLKNSLLIIDEVQTIPKFLLRNLVSHFKVLTESLGCKIILVSATIPHEISTLPRIAVKKEIIDEYLKHTKKDIIFSELNISDTTNQKILIMSNTKKKSANTFAVMQELHPKANLHYITTGIRKKDRINALYNLAGSTECICVSTQVIEAGVDISFSKIFREAAPLDSIIQVMGRLNREGNNKDALLTVFQHDKRWIPYSELEYNESVKILHNASTSIDLYNALEKYYKTISDTNTKNLELAQTLDSYIKEMDYEKVWEFVYSNVLADDHQETVFIPENEEQWNEIKNSIVSSGKISKTLVKKYAYHTASLVASPKKLGIADKFDDDLFEKNILMPKLEHLSEVYDPAIGLDKWLK